MKLLTEYGIHTEDSDVRAHVSVVNRCILAFRTMAGRDAITRLDPPLRSARQPGVDAVTAVGWIVPVDEIEDLRTLRFYSWPKWGRFTPELSTSEKGSLAVQCVIDCLAAGRFPLWIVAEENDERAVQIRGTDIVLSGKTKIQVKCDYRSGPAPLGTGNVFLQQAEMNPLRMT